MYETTFKQETYSDLTGERGVLMGAIAGFFQVTDTLQLSLIIYQFIS